MKYLIVLCLLFTPFLVKADTLYGFLNGNLYSISGDLKAFCFADKSCFNVDGKQIWNVNGDFTTTQPAGGEPIATSSPIIITPVPQNSTVLIAPIQLIASPIPQSASQSSPAPIPQADPIPTPVSEPIAKPDLECWKDNSTYQCVNNNGKSVQLLELKGNVIFNNPYDPVTDISLAKPYSINIHINIASGDGKTANVYNTVLDGVLNQRYTLLPFDAVIQPYNVGAINIQLSDDTGAFKSLSSIIYSVDGVQKQINF